MTTAHLDGVRKMTWGPAVYLDEDRLPGNGLYVEWKHEQEYFLLMADTSMYDGYVVFVFCLPEKRVYDIYALTRKEAAKYVKDKKFTQV
jgi:hypothetical protein